MKGYVTLMHPGLIDLINHKTSLKLNPTNTRLKQKVLFLSDKELKTISVVEFQRNYFNLKQLSDSDFIKEINKKVSS